MIQKIKKIWLAFLSTLAVILVHLFGAFVLLYLITDHQAQAIMFLAFLGVNTAPFILFSVPILLILSNFERLSFINSIITGFIVGSIIGLGGNCWKLVNNEWFHCAGYMIIYGAIGSISALIFRYVWIELNSDSDRE